MEETEESEKYPKMPNLKGCLTDLDCIMQYLKIASDKQLSIIHRNIERIFLYGA